MRVIIAGSRTISNYQDVRKAISDSGFEISEVISGTAPGPDKFGEAFARMNGISVVRFPADWKLHGKRAGIIRNWAMAMHAEALIAIWDGQSRGTKHMINAATSLGLKIFVAEVRECHCAGCDPANWPETNGWRCSKWAAENK